MQGQWGLHKMKAQVTDDGCQSVELALIIVAKHAVQGRGKTFERSDGLGLSDITSMTRSTPASLKISTMLRTLFRLL